MTPKLLALVSAATRELARAAGQDRRGDRNRCGRIPADYADVERCGHAAETSACAGERPSRGGQHGEPGP